MSDGREAAVPRFPRQPQGRTVDVNDVSIDELLADYFGKKPPFVGDLPKPEFPDAIDAKALCEWADQNEVELFVVSGDKGFSEACATCKQIHVFDQLEKLLNRVADDDKKLADFIRAQVVTHIDEIKAEAVKAPSAARSQRRCFHQSAWLPGAATSPRGTGHRHNS
jgi:PIN domain